MSEAPVEERPSVDLPFGGGDAAFSALMDALAPESGAEAAAPAGQNDEQADAGAAGAAGVQPVDSDPTGGGAADGSAGKGVAAGGAEAPVAGAGEAGPAAAGADGGSAERDAVPPGSADGAADGSAEQPAATGEGANPAEWTADSAKVLPELAGLSTKIEENLVNGYRNAAYEDTRREHTKYFEALEVHPRMLIGKQVPSMNGDGMETLRDTNDAREWQEAVKEVLVQEIESRTSTWVQDATGFMETVHASIDLFKNNKDLIPGTKGFDKGLADKFAQMAKPYEVRIEGKLHGYSIPVQPIIDSLRGELKAQQKPDKGPQAALPAKPADPPQAGISSKAATSGEPEDFSTLFGTIGLPQLRI